MVRDQFGEVDCGVLVEVSVGGLLVVVGWEVAVLELALVVTVSVLIVALGYLISVVPHVIN
jgi:hypothetical protein